MTDVWPVPLEDLCKFIAYFSQTNLSHSSIKCYLSGISFFIRVNDFENPTQKFVIKKKYWKGTNVLNQKHETQDYQLLKNALFLF